MKKSIVLLVLFLILVNLAACSNDIGIDAEKYNINENSLVLNDILEKLYKDKKVEPIIYREQKGADGIFDIMGTEHGDYESYAFLYDNEKLEYILVFRPEIFKEEPVLQGIDKLVSYIMEKGGDGGNLLYKDFSDFLVVIYHEKSEEIFKEIEDGMTNWGSEMVDSIL